MTSDGIDRMPPRADHFLHANTRCRLRRRRHASQDLSRNDRQLDCLRRFLAAAPPVSAPSATGSERAAAVRSRELDPPRGASRRPRSAVSPTSSAAAGDAALFLHGFPLNGFQWRGAIERLVGASPLRGAGLSRPRLYEPAEGQSVAPDAQVAMLVALLDELSIPAADVVASDSGGAIAQLLVARHPERVRTLLLANCDAEIDCPPPALLPVIEMSRERTLRRFMARAVACRQTAGADPRKESAACVTSIPRTRPTRPSSATSRRWSIRRGGRPRPTPMPSLSITMCWTVWDRLCAPRGYRPGSCGARATRSSRPRARTFWIAPSARRAACAGSKEGNSSGRRNSRT